MKAKLKRRIDAAINWLDARMTEPSTLAGVLAVLSAFVFHWSPDQQTALAMLGAALFVHPEKKT